MFATILLMSAAAFASPGGKTGVAASGCSCHGKESSKTTVTMEADTLEVDVGDVVNLTMLIENDTAKKSGLDVAAKTGTLAAGSNNKLSGKEITHSSPTSMSGGAVAFDFTWTATTAGAARIYGVGLGADGDGHDNGDQWAFAEDITINVLGDTGADTGGDTATDTGADTAATDTGDTGGDLPPCGCSTGAGGLASVPFAAALLAIRRRSYRPTPSE